MLRLLRYHDRAERELAKYINNVFGFYPRNIALYQLAFTHKSLSQKMNGITVSNERLEYLGDAVLSAIVGEYLFKKYPTKQEGFLTEMRSRIVSRASLNKLSMKFGFEKMVVYVHSNDKHSKFRSLGGNAFEAFTGAIFLDRGYKFTYNIVVERIIKLHLDIDDIEKNDINFKSKILEWSQKNKHNIEFRIVGTKGSNFDKLYVVKVLIDDEEYAEACDYSIKGAEQLAAEKSWHLLQEKEAENN
ncbi:MAG: ribonuclease III [Bacteroidales bacterium]|nr:ribonuclease III [Bacteroidales bacterium]MBR4138236.1 ribonuclease III [Bacteroidales bacterium]